MSTRGDTSVDSLTDEYGLDNDDFDNMLKSFNLTLFQDDKLKLCMDNVDCISANISKEKENFEEFSDMLTELEEGGENLDPIIIGSDLGPLCQPQPMMATPVHFPPTNQQNPMNQDHYVTAPDSDRSEDFEVQDNKALSTSVENDATTGENNVNCLQDIDGPQSSSFQDPIEELTYTFLHKRHDFDPIPVIGIVRPDVIRIQNNFMNMNEIMTTEKEKFQFR